MNKFQLLFCENTTYLQADWKLFLTVDFSDGSMCCCGARNRQGLFKIKMFFFLYHEFDKMGQLIFITSDFGGPEFNSGISQKVLDEQKIP